MNLFKFLIPTDQKKEVTILQSWTVTWEVRERGYGYNYYSKVFIKHDEAKEFSKQLEDAASFIKAYIRTEIKEN